MPNVTQQAHTVPASYLKRFVGAADGMLWVYSKRDGSMHKGKPTKITVERYFYAYDRPDGTKDHSLEGYFDKQIESVSAPIIVRWTQTGSVPTASEIEVMSAFMSYAHLRTRRALRVVTEVTHAALVVDLEAAARDDPQQGRVLATWRRNVGDDSITLEELQEYAERRPAIWSERFRQAAVPTTMQLAEHMRDVLAGLQWHLCDAPHHAFFITSDTPVVVTVDGAPTVSGFPKPDAEVFMPISSTAAILLSHHRRSTSRLLLDVETVRYFNRCMVFVAERDVISLQESDEIARLVAEFRSTQETQLLDPQLVRDIYRKSANDIGA